MSKSNKKSDEKRLAIGKAIKALSKYASTLTLPETLNLILSISERHLKWNTSVDQLTLPAEERNALNSALVQNIEQVDPEQLETILSTLAQTQVLWQHFVKPVKTGLTYALWKNLPILSPESFASVLQALGKMRYTWAEMDEAIHDLLFSAFRQHIYDFSAEALFNTFMALSQMNLVWSTLSSKIKEQFSKRLKQHIKEYGTTETRDLFVTFAKLQYQKEPKKILLCLISLLNRHIEHFTEKEGREIWNAYRMLAITQTEAGKPLHNQLWELSFPLIAEQQAKQAEAQQKSRHTRRRRASPPGEMHHSPDPYYDYTPFLD